MNDTELNSLRSIAKSWHWNPPGPVSQNMSDLCDAVGVSQDRFVSHFDIDSLECIDNLPTECRRLARELGLAESMVRLAYRLGVLRQALLRFSGFGLMRLDYLPGGCSLAGWAPKEAYHNEILELLRLAELQNVDRDTRRLLDVAFEIELQ